MRHHRRLQIALALLAVVLAACQPALGAPPEPIASEPVASPRPTEVPDSPPQPSASADESLQVGYTAQGDPYRGKLDAPVVIEEFSSFQCPFCARHFRESYPQIVAEYVEMGQVLYIFRDYPLAGQLQSRQAAESASCAGELGGGKAFWEMHDRLFEGQAEWAGKLAPGAVFQAYAEQQGLDRADFAECLDSGATRAGVEADASEGTKRGVRGTPTFFINGRPLVGAQPYEVIARAIDAALSGEAVPTVEPPPAPTPVAIAPGDGVMTLGDADAAVTIVEFSDYQCPYCASYFRETWPQLKAQFVDTGRVRYVFKDSPLTGLHPQAPKAHEAARCAGEQGAYWEMHDMLFERQAQWGGNTSQLGLFEGYASELGLRTEDFVACLETDRWSSAVSADMSEGARLGVSGTPTFFIDGYPIVGAQSYELFEYAIGLAEQGELAGAYRRSE